MIDPIAGIFFLTRDKNSAIIVTGTKKNKGK